MVPTRCIYYFSRKNMKSCSLGILLAIVFISCNKADDFACDRNTKVSLSGRDICYTGIAQYTSGTDPNGNAREDFQIDFAAANGVSFTLYVNSVPYQPPFVSIGQLKENADYSVSNNHANLYIDDIVQLLEGSVKFSQIDRTARKVAGSFSFTYVINTSSGNKNVPISGSFSDVSF